MQTNSRWARLGCTLLVTLISNPDGQRFLADDPFLLQIVDCFAQLDPVSHAKHVKENVPFPDGSIATVQQQSFFF
jgi:hypothetical protein